MSQMLMRLHQPLYREPLGGKEVYVACTLVASGEGIVHDYRMVTSKSHCHHDYQDELHTQKMGSYLPWFQ